MDYNIQSGLLFFTTHATNIAASTPPSPHPHTHTPHTHTSNKQQSTNPRCYDFGMKTAPIMWCEQCHNRNQPTILPLVISARADNDDDNDDDSNPDTLASNPLQTATHSSRYCRGLELDWVRRHTTACLPASLPAASASARGRMHVNTNSAKCV